VSDVMSFAIYEVSLLTRSSIVSITTPTGLRQTIRTRTTAPLSPLNASERTTGTCSICRMATSHLLVVSTVCSPKRLAKLDHHSCSQTNLSQLVGPTERRQTLTRPRMRFVATKDSLTGAAEVNFEDAERPLYSQRIDLAGGTCNSN
jgi:hypothetical protein